MYIDSPNSARLKSSHSRTTIDRGRIRKSHVKHRYKEKHASIGKKDRMLSSRLRKGPGCKYRRTASSLPRVDRAQKSLEMLGRKHKPRYKPCKLTTVVKTAVELSLWMLNPQADSNANIILELMMNNRCDCATFEGYSQMLLHDLSRTARNVRNSNTAFNYQISALRDALGWDWMTFRQVHEFFYWIWETCYTLSHNGLKVVWSMERAAQVLETQLNLSVRKGSFYEQLNNIKYAIRAGLADSQQYRQQLFQEDFDVEMEDVQEEGRMDWEADDPSAYAQTISATSIPGSPTKSQGFTSPASSGAFGSSTASSGFESLTSTGAFGSSTTSPRSSVAPVGAQPTASSFSEVSSNVPLSMTTTSSSNVPMSTAPKPTADDVAAPPANSLPSNAALPGSASSTQTSGSLAAPQSPSLSDPSRPLFQGIPGLGLLPIGPSPSQPAPAPAQQAPAQRSSKMDAASAKLTLTASEPVKVASISQEQGIAKDAEDMQQPEPAPVSKLERASQDTTSLQTKVEVTSGSESSGSETGDASTPTSAQPPPRGISDLPVTAAPNATLAGKGRRKMTLNEPKDATVSEIMRGVGAFSPDHIVSEASLLPFFNNKHFQGYLDKEIAATKTIAEQEKLNVRGNHVFHLLQSLDWILLNKDKSWFDGGNLDLADSIAGAWRRKIEDLAGVLRSAELSDKAEVASDVLRKITKVSYIMAGSEELDRTFYPDG